MGLVGHRFLGGGVSSLTRDTRTPGHSGESARPRRRRDEGPRPPSIASGRLTCPTREGSAGRRSRGRAGLAIVKPRARRRGLAGVSCMVGCGVGRPSREQETRPAPPGRPRGRARLERQRPSVRYAVLILRLRPERRPAMTDAKGIPYVAHVEGVVGVALDGGLARAVGAPREISD